VITGDGALATVPEKAAVAVSAVGLVESVTSTEKLNAARVLGVPEITPPEETPRPAGSDPESMVQEYGGVPP
jgi:hypothetical protein